MDGEVPSEVLEFFLPEAEEHLQIIIECLLSLEGNSNQEEINRLFRSIHTIKGSAAQVGLHRLSAVAHSLEELIGQMRSGALQPSAAIVDLCLDGVDALRKFLHRGWTDEAEMREAVEPLLIRISELAPEFVANLIAPTPESESVTVGADSHSEGAPLSSTSDEADAKEHADIQAGAALVAASRSAGPPAPSKSVRIALDRLDRMMNAVGELVINRTRMIGRLKELGKLVEVLNFSKARLTGKVSEFQEKHEYSHIGVGHVWTDSVRMARPRGFGSRMPSSPDSATRLAISASWNSIATTTSIFFRAP